jgi:hypothetical protein
VLGILEAAGYQAPLCIQYKGPDDAEIYARDVRFVRECTTRWLGA